MSVTLCALYSFGALIRYCLLNSTLQSAIAARVEVSTPLNAWLRVKEGAFLQNQGISVYSGGVYHGSPLELLFSSFLLRHAEQYLTFVFIFCDLLTAYLLSLVSVAYSKMLLRIQEKEKKNYSKDSLPLLLTESDLKNGSHYASVAYLFCPYIIASCVGQTTTVFSNLILTSTLLAMLNNRPLLFGFLAALSTYQSFYPVCLLVPGILATGDGDFGLQGGISAPSRRGLYKVLISFVGSLLLLLLWSREIAGGWEFIDATYGFILCAPDLTPNIGLFWYFFTEMFEHFRLFFLATFQINIFVYLIPLSTKLRFDPMLLSMALFSLMAVFRSYPSLGDVGFYLSLLPLYYHLDPYLRQIFLVGCMLFGTSVLGPIMYNLWIFNGSANANFYFAITLAFNTAQIFLVTDLLFAQKKRRYHLFSGSAKDIDGHPADLSLE